MSQHTTKELEARISLSVLLAAEMSSCSACLLFRVQTQHLTEHLKGQCYLRTKRWIDTAASFPDG